MNPIFTALSSGHNPKDILKYLMKAIPQMAPNIKKAQRAGYQAQQILGFLSKTFETEDRTGMSESERHAVNRRADASRAKYGLKTAAIAAATPIAAAATGAALSRALPSSLQGLIGSQVPGVSQSHPSNNLTTPNVVNPLQSASAPTSPINPTQTPQKLLSPQNPPVESNNITQPVESVQPEINTLPVENVLDNFGIKERVDALLNNNDVPTTSAAVWSLLNPNQKKAYEKALKAGEIKPLEEVIDEYSKLKLSSKEPKQESFELSPTLQGAENPINTDILPDNTDKIKELQKESTVISPVGLGRIKELRNGKAMLEIDGKKHVVNEDELIESPLPEKELEELYDDLISGIEKKTGQEVSRNVHWAGYDQNTNELAYH